MLCGFFYKWAPKTIFTIIVQKYISQYKQIIRSSELQGKSDGPTETIVTQHTVTHDIQTFILTSLYEITLIY